METQFQQPALAFVDFSFKYKSQDAPTLHGINLAVRPGEKILIVGPSGSGKSTLAHCINGLIPHAFKGRWTGTYTLDGGNALDLDIFGISKKVGTVLQDPDGQFVALSAGEDIAFVLENDCETAERMHSRVKDAASLVDIGDFLDKAPQDLSGGQKQRVAMAGVLIDDVDILLFDEPLANLDPATGKQAIDLIDRLHKETGKTILIIEHRLEDVLYRKIDRIVVIDGGRILADLPPDEMLASEILRTVGIREPLYLSALRYAGTDITAASLPSSVDTVAFDPVPLRNWDSRQEEAGTAAVHPSILEMEHLGFSYSADESRKAILDDVSFTLHEGESTALVGRNGAGKSTLAKLVCGFEIPSAGTIRFAGKDLANFSIKQRADHIGYVMQNPNQMISLPMVYDEVSLGLRSRGVDASEAARRVDETLKICGLHPFRKWPVSALSFGQKKRLTIASILVLGPRLLILDEPTAGQDFRHYTDIMEFLRTLNRDTGLTLLMVTHDMHLMLEYTTRAIVLSGGKKIADASPAGVLTDEAVIEGASLKRTSLYDLAIRAGIGRPRDFVQHFIDFDRRRRSR